MTEEYRMFNLHLFSRRRKIDDETTNTDPILAVFTAAEQQLDKPDLLPEKRGYSQEVADVCLQLVIQELETEFDQRSRWYVGQTLIDRAGAATHASPPPSLRSNLEPNDRWDSENKKPSWNNSVFA